MSAEEVEARATRLRFVEEARLASIGAFAGLPPAILALLGPLAWLSHDLFALSVVFGTQLIMAVWAAMLGVPALVAWLSATRENGRLVATFRRDEGLRVAGVHLPTDTLALAWARTPTEVEVLTQGGDELTLELEQPAEAAALVAAIRGATDARRAYPVALEGDGWRLTRKAWAWLAPLTVGIGFLWAGPAYLPVFAAGAGLGWLGSRGTRRLRFGADGVAIEGRFRKRYVRYGDIARVAVQRTLGAVYAVRLVLTTGRVVTVGSLIGHHRAKLVRALIEEGIAMHEAGAAAGAHVAALERGEQDPEAWRTRVEAVGKARGYRGAALDHDRLLSLMRNPAATSAQRVAAALALRADSGGVARIRVAAEVSAEPSVRETFEQLAEEELDEARLGKLLRRLDASG